MSQAVARRIALRASGLTTGDVDGTNIIIAVIVPADPSAPPPPRVPSSKTIARLREKAEAAARTASAARALKGQVQRAYRPPAGRVFAVDTAGLLLIGPIGALGTTSRMARTLEPLAAGGRHPAAALVSAGAWQDEAALREGLAGADGKLAALGLRIERRKAGLRMAKVKPS